MKRAAIKILCLLALALSGWWWIATTALHSTVTDYFEARRAQGWQAAAADISRAGFPLRIAAVVEGIALADPRAGLAWSVPQITVSAPIYWPGHADLNVSQHPVTLTTPKGVLAYTATKTQAALRLRPGTALQLQELRGVASGIVVSAPETELARAGALRATAQQGTSPEIYRINLSADALTPGPLLRRALVLPTDWPDEMETFVADMTVTFDRPWDRSALDLTRPQPRKIMLERAQVVWGDLDVSMAADISVDETGTPSGNLRVQARNWQNVLDLFIASGAISEQMRPQLENGLRLFSGMSGDREALDIEVTIEDGRMRIGFIPLGSAPALVIR